MKLALLIWQDPYHRYAGGAEFYLWEYMVRLADRHEIHWFGCRDRDQPAQERRDGITYHRRGPWHLANFTVPTLYRAWRRNHRPDLLLESITKVPFYAPLFEREVPIAVFVPHLFGATVFQETNPLLGSYVWLSERPIPWLYRNRPFLVISESTREDLIQRGIPESQIFLVPPGVAVDRYTPGGHRSSTPLVVYLGRLKRYKRIDLALQAFRLVRERKPDAEMVVIGDGDYAPALKRLAEKLGLMNRGVRFLGLVPEKEKIRWLQKAWLLVNTSPKEGWGMVNTEAQACGTPVVAFDAPGIRDSIRPGKSGFLVTYGDVAALAEAMLRILENPELRDRMGKAGRAWVETLHWDRLARDLEAFLLNIVP